MQSISDLHTHSILSHHAFSTFDENVRYAKEKGLKYYGISDHQYDDLNIGANRLSFLNLKVLPDELYGVKILKGVELNILDNGEIAFTNDLLNNIDYCIISMHTYAYSTKHTKDENTIAYLNAMEHNKVKIIGHMDNANYPCDLLTIIKKAKEKEILIELNNSSQSPNSFRKNAHELGLEILNICKELKCPIIINSDAHICYDVGNIKYALKLIDEANFPLDLIVNFNEELFLKYFG